MKKLSYFPLIIIIIIHLVSCSSDDSPDNSADQSLILGKWQLVKVTRSTGEITLSDCRKEETLTFSDNGNIENYYVDNDPCDYSTITFQYSVNGSELTFSIPGEGDNGGTYILKSRMLSLTENKLEFQSFNDNEIGDFPDSQKETQEYTKI
ncbi:lipocalin family protein [Aquimarina celericrescens]|uniref:Lipocalin family protein n=1 Tax=Aquimarina celericrescens TaxID=1964542 RepID=A0ABW5ASP4_9FLAO|nr:lipocalin family protein [Aquimarina celericrescens]